TSYYSIGLSRRHPDCRAIIPAWCRAGWSSTVSSSSIELFQANGELLPCRVAGNVEEERQDLGEHLSLGDPQTLPTLAAAVSEAQPLVWVSRRAYPAVLQSCRP